MVETAPRSLPRIQNTISDIPYPSSPAFVLSLTVVFNSVAARIVSMTSATPAATATPAALPPADATPETAPTG